MSRNNSRRPKAGKKVHKRATNKHRQLRRGKFGSPSALSTGLDEAESRLRDGSLDEAIEILEELSRRYPRRAEVLERLLDAYAERDDVWAYKSTCQQFLQLRPDSLELWLSLAGAALENGQMATAHRAFDHIVCHWPEDPNSGDGRKVRDGLDEVLRCEAAKYQIPSESMYELLLLHDEINLRLQQGNYDGAISMAGRLLARCPAFTPALNNRSEARFRLGQLELAVADSRLALEIDVNNFHALANLARFLFLGGQFEEARSVSERLKAVESDSPELFVKQSESLAILGDWNGVLQALERAERRGGDRADAMLGLLYHLAGVAAAELGRLDDARRHWKRASEMKVAADWARANLDDLQRPTGEQNGPWAFPLQYWIPRATLERLAAVVLRSDGSGSDAEFRRRVRKLLEPHPYLEKLAPVLLDRGDAAAKEFVVRVASLGWTPCSLSALRDFAFGRRGTDELRYAAARRLVDTEVIDAGLLRMWVQGELREVNLMSFEIVSEPVDPLPKNVERMATQAWDAIHDGNGAAAEILLDRALRLNPDIPSLEFNRTVAIQLQGRGEEALALVRDLHERHPDYLFARVVLAQEAIEQRDFETARAFLDPLMRRRRFHLSEYTAMCHAYIELLFTQGEKEGAGTWLKMWQEVAPDDERTMYWAARLGKRGLLSKWLS